MQSAADGMAFYQRRRNAPGVHGRLCLPLADGKNAKGEQKVLSLLGPEHKGVTVLLAGKRPREEIEGLNLERGAKSLIMGSLEPKWPSMHIINDGSKYWVSSYCGQQLLVTLVEAAGYQY